MAAQRGQPLDDLHPRQIGGGEGQGVKCLKRPQHPQRRGEGQGGPANDGRHAAQHQDRPWADASPPAPRLDPPHEGDLDHDRHGPQQAGDGLAESLRLPGDGRETIVESVGRLHRADRQNGGHEGSISGQGRQTGEPLSAGETRSLGHRLGRQQGRGRQRDQGARHGDPDDDPVHRRACQDRSHQHIGRHEGRRAAPSGPGEVEAVTPRHGQGQDVGQRDQSRCCGRGDEPQNPLRHDPIDKASPAVTQRQHEAQDGDRRTSPSEPVRPDRDRRARDQSRQHGRRQQDADLGAGKPLPSKP